MGAWIDGWIDEIDRCMCMGSSSSNVDIVSLRYCDGLTRLVTTPPLL